MGKFEKLGDVCDFVGGSQPAKSNFVYDLTDLDKSAYTRLIQIRDYKSDKHIVYIPKVSTKKFCKADDVMIGRYGPPVFQILRGLEGAYNVALMKAIPKLGLLNNEYLFYFLMSPSIQNYIIKLSERASGQTGVNKPALHGFPILVPSISEQKRIVALLDTVFADLEQTRAKTEQNLKNARELFDSYLQQVFSQKGDSCNIRSMSDKSMLLMIDGDRGKNYPKKSEFLPEGHCLFLSTKNVRPDGFLFDQTMFIDESRDSLLRKGKLERNDVVITTRGTIGNLALYDDGVEFNNIRINSGMLILRPNSEIILPSYLFEIMRSGIVRKQIDEKVSGAAQPQLPVNTLNSFSFPVPSLEEQKHIVDLTKEAEVKINELTRIYTKKLAAIDELKKSILQKAFSGELTQ
ncbi:restriction endonuclease subunit S [Psychromonas algicola]|uniref:restriction endonuclease subunit S n=1 Tax=Psychromonas algicola TaxID=2555642 RepID=UPI001067ACE7|nr:restriction endonuclease subunit S [Psychromonas sp. RZ5]TEW52175.1 restriction endonuclease subunit S [Psychromonas sp. RZ5]